jgi:hypothetical protein
MNSEAFLSQLQVYLELSNKLSCDHTSKSVAKIEYKGLAQILVRTLKE